MGVIDNLGEVFGGVWLNISDFITLILVIIWAILFFVVQYYLIKGYIWLFKKIGHFFIILKDYKYNILDYIKDIDFKKVSNKTQ